jgi:hypothetical protein
MGVRILTYTKVAPAVGAAQARRPGYDAAGAPSGRIAHADRGTTRVLKLKNNLGGKHYTTKQLQLLTYVA